MSAPSDAGENFDVPDSFVRTFTAGDVICRPGDPLSHLFVLRDGVVEVVDRSNVTRTVQVGDPFCEGAFFDGRPADLTARARSTASVFQLSRTALERITSERPEIALAMMHRIARRLPPGTVVPRADGAATPPAPAPVPPPAPVAAPSPVTPARVPAGDPVLVHIETGTTIPLRSLTEATVGREDRASGTRPALDLTPFDGERTLSRRHATLRRRDDRWLLSEEPNVRNGTFVNGDRLVTGIDVELHDGDQVQFGLVKTVFHWA